MEELRKKIQDVDSQIIRLVAERLSLAKKIAEAKQDKGLPTKNFQVERDLLSSNKITGEKHGLDQSIVTALTKLLIHYSTITQEELRQSYRQQHGPSEHIVIVGGHGQMGQWFANYFASLGHKVSCVDKNPQPKSGSSFEVLPSLKQACKQADVLVLATPLGSTSKVLLEVTEIGFSGLVFDIASLKSPLISSIETAASKKIKIGSIHPMFGPDAKLLLGKNILVCRFQGSCKESELLDYFSQTSANLTFVDLAEHDKLMNNVLGLSHLVNLIFADVLRKSKLNATMVANASSSTFAALFAVAERVVQENESLYFEIQHLNRYRHELHSLLHDSLSTFTELISSGNQQEFEKTMLESRRYFDEIAAEL